MAHSFPISLRFEHRIKYHRAPPAVDVATGDPSPNHYVQSLQNLTPVLCTKGFEPRSLEPGANQIEMSSLTVAARHQRTICRAQMSPGLAFTSVRVAVSLSQFPLSPRARTHDGVVAHAS